MHINVANQLNEKTKNFNHVISYIKPVTGYKHFRLQKYKNLENGNWLHQTCNRLHEILF